MKLKKPHRHLQHSTKTLEVGSEPFVSMFFDWRVRPGESVDPAILWRGRNGLFARHGFATGH